MDVYIKNVWDELGSGYSEAVYQNSLEYELQMYGIKYDRRPVNIIYKERSVGYMIPDIVIDNECIIELKSVKKLNEDHIKQLKIYMKMLGIPKGYLVNFGDDLTILQF